MLPFFAPETPSEEVLPSRTPVRHFSYLAALLLGFVGGLAGVVFANTAKIFPADNGEVGSTTLQEKVNVVTEDDTLIDLVEKTSPGVVSVVITKNVQTRTPSFGNFPFFFDPFSFDVPSPEGATEKQAVGSGSGFFATADGLIITNKHVVSDPDAEYTVTVQGNKEYSATVLARDPNNDIAVLKIEGGDFPALTLGDSDALRVGQTAIAIGNPLGEFANSVSRGIISGLGRNVSASSGFGEEERLTNIIQTDAAINPGNSGGPLFNLNREVIGVNVAVAQGAENIGFALPINSVKRIIEQVRTTGKITTPYLGVRHVLVNAEIQKENNLPYNYGALILRGKNMADLPVIPGSPADKVGLVENDIILEVDGEKVDINHPLGGLIGNRNVGDEVTLKVWHRGETKDIRVKLEERLP